MSVNLDVERATFQQDPRLVERLEHAVLPEMFKDEQRTSVRIWVPNTGSGENAYWIAALLTEYMVAHELTCDVRVFGTDRD